MALVYDRVKEEAVAIQAVCNDVGFMLAKIQQILTHNSNQAIDWAADPKPSYIDEDSAGNLNGLTFSRVEVANAVGSLDAIRAVIQGDHMGNLNHLTQSTTVRA